MILDSINQELLVLKEKKNYRSLPPLIHDGREVILNGQRMLNLSIKRGILKDNDSRNISAYFLFFPIADR